ncbi:MAG: hypothetical protein ACRD0V_14000 [Acidimicrobiales bacterium]
MAVTEFRESPPVRRWLDRAGYGDRPTAEQDRLLDDLAGFCEYTGRTPEELVASCLRQTDAGTAISTKGRRRMQETIESYVADRGLAGREAIIVGNRIRGFLVHNGVFIQGRAATS